MKRSTVIGLVGGTALIGLVLFKNVYRLYERIEEDRSKVQTYENDLLTIQFPRNLVHERDTIYLGTGEMFNTVHGVAGSLSNEGKTVQYSLSVARFSKELSTRESFHLDSMRTNLSRKLADSDMQLLRFGNVTIQGVEGLTYVRRIGQDFERSIMFPLDNNVIAINMKGADSVDVVFEEIIRSVKIKMPYDKANSAGTSGINR
jgi:tetrahydromethanopterin S-methyltransferase subunit B